MSHVLDPKYIAAVRTAHRLYCQLHARSDEGRRADEGFDCGEFSGPAHDEMLEDAIDDMFVRVATAYNVCQKKLAIQHMSYAHSDMHHMHGHTIFARMSLGHHPKFAGHVLTTHKYYSTSTSSWYGGRRFETLPEALAFGRVCKEMRVTVDLWVSLDDKQSLHFWSTGTTNRGVYNK